MVGSLLDLPSDIWALITSRLLAGPILNLLSVGNRLLAFKVSSGVHRFEASDIPGFLDCNRILRSARPFKSIQTLEITSRDQNQLPKWNPCWEGAPSTLIHLKLDFKHSMRLFFDVTHLPSQTLPNLISLFIKDFASIKEEPDFSLKNLPTNLEFLELTSHSMYCFYQSDFEHLPRTLKTCLLDVRLEGPAPNGELLPQLTTFHFKLSDIVIDPRTLPKTITDLQITSHKRSCPSLSAEEWRETFPLLNRIHIADTKHTRFSLQELEIITPTTDQWNSGSWGSEADGSYDIIVRRGPSIISKPSGPPPEHLWKHFTKIEVMGVLTVDTTPPPPNLRILTARSIRVSLIPPRIQELTVAQLIWDSTKAPHETFPSSLTRLTVNGQLFDAASIALLPSNLIRFSARINDTSALIGLSARLASLASLTLHMLQRFSFADLPPSLTHLHTSSNLFTDITAFRNLTNLTVISIFNISPKDGYIPVELLHNMPPNLLDFNSSPSSRPLRREDLLALPRTLRRFNMGHSMFSWRDFSDPLRNSSSSVSSNEEIVIGSSSSSLEPHQDSSISSSLLPFPPGLTSLRLPDLPISVEQTVELLPKHLSVLEGSSAVAAAYYKALPDVVSEFTFPPLNSS